MIAPKGAGQFRGERLGGRVGGQSGGEVAWHGDPGGAVSEGEDAADRVAGRGYCV